MKTLVSAALLLAWGTFVSSAQVVDVHSHIIPGAYTDFLRAHHAELAPYAEQILHRNAQQFFERNNKQ